MFERLRSYRSRQMARPTETIDDERVLVSYLLGLLPEEEAERLDEASIVDDGIAARLADTETDLIDAYVAGALSGDARQRFEVVYLRSRRTRSRVESARRFRAAIDRTSPATASPRQAFVRPLLAAAATLIVAGGVVFQALQGGWWPLQRPAPQQAEVTAGASAPTVVLSPQVRAAGEVPTIVIGPGTGELAIDLRLESNDFSWYEVALVDPHTDGTLWRSDVLTPLTRGAAALLSIGVPASLFSSQHYAFELSGVDPLGRPKAIGSYAVEIVRR